jgi:hypothetical protein
MQSRLYFKLPAVAGLEPSALDRICIVLPTGNCVSNSLEVTN